MVLVDFLVSDFAEFVLVVGLPVLQFLYFFVQLMVLLEQGLYLGSQQIVLHLQMVDGFEYAILLGLVFVEDSVFEQILDDEYKSALAFFIEGHDGVNVILLVWGLGQHSDDELEHLEGFLDVVVLGDFDQVKVLGFDALLDLLLKVLLNECDDLLEVGQTMRPVGAVFDHFGIFDFEVRCRLQKCCENPPIGEVGEVQFPLFVLLDGLDIVQHCLLHICHVRHYIDLYNLNVHSCPQNMMPSRSTPSAGHEDIRAQMVLGSRELKFNCITHEDMFNLQLKQKLGMINFASLFNQFRMGGSSIGDLIDSAGVTLDRLLDQDSFSNEFKSGNSKVQQFMKYDKYETLVKYITEVGPPEDRKRSYKYPLSACQLLSSDNNQTLDFFFGENPIIVKEEVIEDQEPKKATTDTENASKEEKAKAAEKVVIKDKLDSEDNSQPPQAAEQKPHTEGEQHAEESARSESIQQQDKSSIEANQQYPGSKLKTIDRQVEPLRHALFAYFKGEVNYTLAGYVCKVFASLFSKKPVMVMKFLLDSERFKNILNHVESRSVGQLVVKILTYESAELMEQRKIAFEQMLQKMSKNDQIFVISNLSTPICETIEKVAASVKANNQSSIELSHLFFTPAIITQIISNVMSDEQNVSVYNAPILQTYLTNVPLVIPEKSQITEDLKMLLLSFLKKTLEKLKIKRQSRPTLGFGRMKIVEIMSFVLKQNILSARELAASESQFFPTLFSLCRNYQYNNILHNEVVKIVEIALNEPEGSAFLHSLLRDQIFLKFLSAENEEDQKIRAGSGPQKSRKGYIGHLVLICRKFQQYSSKNQAVARFTERKQFQKVIEELVNKEVYEYNKSLAGYSMKRGNKHSILFGKEDIIQEHIKFLAATPAPIYENEPEPINIEHPDLIEAQKMQIEAAKEEEKQAQKVKEEEESFDPRFFESHLQYNVDDLMNDL